MEPQQRREKDLLNRTLKLKSGNDSSEKSVRSGVEVHATAKEDPVQPNQ